MTATQPPSGTVTFLFTDIEGSTRLEQAGRHRPATRSCASATATSCARRSRRTAATEQGTEGDSFFVVFGERREAVAAAIDAQRALAAEPWPDDAAVRVRMGLHSGEAELVGGSLVGLDINRAARIAAAAHGGQILISDATRGARRRAPARWRAPAGPRLRSG